MINEGPLKRRLSGIKDSRGMQGMLSRGKNVYLGGSNAAQQGGGSQFGRPRKKSLNPAIQRRLNKGR